MKQEKRKDIETIMPDEYLLAIVGEDKGEGREIRHYRARLPGLRGTFQLLSWFAIQATTLMAAISTLKPSEAGEAISTGNYDKLAGAIVSALTALRPEELGFVLQVLFRLKPEKEEDRESLEYILDYIPTSAFLELVKWVLGSEELKTILGNGKAVVDLGKSLFPPTTAKAQTKKKEPDGPGFSI